MNKLRFREVNTGDWIKSILYTLIIVGIIVWGAFLMIPDGYLSLFVASVAILLFSLVVWHARTFGYRCEKCSNEFTISAFTDLISPSGINKSGGWKYLKCPKCGQRSKATVVKVLYHATNKPKFGL